MCRYGSLRSDSRTRRLRNLLLTIARYGRLTVGDRYRPFPSLAIVTMCMGQGPNSASRCVNAVTETSTPSAVATSTENTEISRLRKDLERLASAVNALSTSDGSSRARGRIHDRVPRSRGQSRSRSPSSKRPDNRCWYHRTFGDKARKCNCDVTSPSGNGPASH